MRKLLVLMLSILLFGNNLAFSKTQCKRPKWKQIYIEKEKCYMDVRHYVLYQTSLIEVELKRKDNRCYVGSGLWEVPYVDGELIQLTTPSLIEIDHIVPWCYISRHIECEDASKYYNFVPNLKPVAKQYNAKKGCSIGLNTAMLIEQQIACKAIAEKFGNKKLCLNVK